MGRVADSAHWDTYAGLLKPDTIGRVLSTRFSPSALGRRLIRGGVTLAEEGRDIYGFLDAVEDDGATVVSAINVDPVHQRRGAGRALVESAGESAGDRPLRADVLLGNDHAERFFEALGFVPGEIEQRRLFEEDVIERRWWREPLS